MLTREAIMSNRLVILTIILFLGVALVYSPYSALSVPNRSNTVNCAPTGKQSENGLQLVKCCWAEKVPPGTGRDGSDHEIYCSECEDGGTRGKINCSDPELQYFKTGGRLGQLADPLQDGGTLEQLQPSSPPPVSTPKAGGDDSIFSSDNQILQQQPDQGATQTNDDNNNQPPVKNKAKRLGDSANVLEQPQNGELTTKKRGNKDNSPTPPACPTDNSPIPPDCTLKPKF